jgi:thymidylate synthase
LLTHILAQVCGYQVGEFVHTYGDIHVYGNHYDQVREQISRTPRPFPKIWINPAKKEIDDFEFDDFKILDYDPHPAIKGDITVVGGFDEKERAIFGSSKS